MLLGHPDMTAGEAFSSFICSHLMTPAINAGLALLQVGQWGLEVLYAGEWAAAA